jgi:hypothetical protein
MVALMTGLSALVAPATDVSGAEVPLTAAKIVSFR